MMDVSMLIQNAKEGCGLDEKELLRQLQKQRAGALEAALAQYGAYVLAVIRNRSRGVLTPEDHEEIASDVFLALWRGAKNITRGQLRPWLGAVARKQTAEAMRKKNVYLPLEDDVLITLDRLWEQMVEKERCEALAQALAAQRHPGDDVIRSRKLRAHRFGNESTIDFCVPGRAAKFIAQQRFAHIALIIERRDTCRNEREVLPSTILRKRQTGPAVCADTLAAGLEKVMAERAPRREKQVEQLFFQTHAVPPFPSRQRRPL